MKAIDIDIEIEGQPHHYCYLELEAFHSVNKTAHTYILYDQSAEGFPKPVLYEFSTDSAEENIEKLASYLKDKKVLRIRDTSDFELASQLKLHLYRLKNKRVDFEMDDFDDLEGDEKSAS